MDKIKIGNRYLGKDFPALVVAEVGVNHEGKTKEAKKLIKLCSTLGIGAVKFQTYKAKKLTTPRAMKYWHLSSTDKPTQRQIDTFKNLDGLPKDSYKDLVKYGEELGVIVFSTPFDEESVDLLYESGVPAFKVASGDITYQRLLKKIGETRLPLILSVGASNDDEIIEALDVIKSTGNDNIILLHCILDYPTEEKNANLKVIARLKDKFNVPVGFSDHTLGYSAPLIAVREGACLIEKHCTGKKYDEKSHKSPLSPDHCFLSMDEIGDLTVKIKNFEQGTSIEDISETNIESILGSNNPVRPLACEKAAHIGARRSLVASRDIKKGEIITEDNIVELRPGTGIIPTIKNIENIMGKRLLRDIKTNDLIIDTILS